MTVTSVCMLQTWSSSLSLSSVCMYPDHTGRNQLYPGEQSILDLSLEVVLRENHPEQREIKGLLSLGESTALWVDFWLQHAERGKKDLFKALWQLVFQIKLLERSSVWIHFRQHDSLWRCHIFLHLSKPNARAPPGHSIKVGLILGEFSVSLAWRLSLLSLTGSFLASYTVQPRIPCSRTSFSLLPSALSSKFLLPVQSQEKASRSKFHWNVDIWLVVTLFGLFVF